MIKQDKEGRRDEIGNEMKTEMKFKKLAEISGQVLNHAQTVKNKFVSKTVKLTGINLKI